MCFKQIYPTSQKSLKMYEFSSAQHVLTLDPNKSIIVCLGKSLGHFDFPSSHCIALTAEWSKIENNKANLKSLHSMLLGCCILRATYLDTA